MQSAIGADVVDAVMDEIDLAVAIELAVNGALDDLAVEAADAGLDRLAVGRRGFEVGDIADAEQAHVQRARNRRGRESQHVDRGAQGLEPLLVFDAESLLLVDDDQSQVFERDVFLQDAVGADQDVDLSLGRPDFKTSRISDLGRKRLTTSIANGNSAMRAAKLRWCCSARIVVGTSTATCLPESTARNAARMATSVLP